MKLLTPKQCAERATVSLSLIYALLRSRRLPALRVGVNGKGKWLVRQEDLDSFLKTCVLSGLPQDEGELKHIKP